MANKKKKHKKRTKITAAERGSSRIKRARVALGLSQAQLGERIGAVAQRICLLERGVIEPSLRTFRLLVKALNVPAWWLLGMSAPGKVRAP